MASANAPSRENLAATDPQRYWSSRYVGSWWNRTSTIEVDLVGGTKKVVTPQVTFLGSVKWSAPKFTHQDLHELMAARQNVPGAQVATPLVGVCTGTFEAHPDLELSADNLLAAWA